MGCCASRDDPAGPDQRQLQRQPQPAIRPSQLSHPTIDPTTGLPYKKKKKKKKGKEPEAKPDMSKTCAHCGTAGTLFSKEGFSYASMECLKAHASSAEFKARFEENERLRNP